MSPTDPAVIAEQVAWWQANQYSPAGAMTALGELFCATRPPSWGDVEEVLRVRGNHDISR